MVVRASGAPTVLLVRHGETEWSAVGRHTGRTDLDLSEAGRAAARSLGRALRDLPVDLVLTSPLRRASETCRLAGFGERGRVDDDLREWDYGDYEGRTTVDIRRDHPGWSLWRDGCPGGETAADVGQRADRVIGRLLADADTAVVFAHGHLLCVLGARWAGLPAEAGAAFALDTASLSTLGWQREQRVIRGWNARA